MSAQFYEPSTATAIVPILPRDPDATYTGKNLFPNGQPATLSARLQVGGAGLPGKAVTISIGTQSCTGITDTNGSVSCFTTTLAQSVGPNAAITVNFVGDLCYNGVTGSATALVFEFPSVGAFFIGDAVVGSGSRTFLSDDWFSLNPMSGSPAPTDLTFTGFALDIRSAAGTQSQFPV